MTIPTEQQVDDLARELCDNSDNELGCTGNCATCYFDYWKRYREQARAVALKWEMMRDEQ